MLALTAVAMACGLMDLLAIARGWEKARYGWKPGTMVVILLLAVLGADFGDALDRWLLAGLVLSLAGDVFLVLPKERFLSGLLAFFAAHVCYMAAFAPGRGGSLQGLAEHQGIVAGVLAAFGAVYFFLLAKGVLRSGGRGLLVAVACYILVILGMVWRAATSGDAWIFTGAVLFMISDSVLAWNRFVKGSRVFEVLVMVTYYAAQVLLAWSVS
ncbi:lysoplasmalogenase [Tumebacillus flagellatus]|uniref:Lysoplasmalogenase n=1 Tax=Tumebacillus flagellatus TaxID=1157490 RepID=A0A074LRE1_9BACL|nr:hypothetical protein EL26_08265 [Tumebacillus flagellatus]